MNGWVSKRIGDVCLFSNGLWKGEKPPFANVGVIRNTNFTKDGTLDDSDIAYLDVEAKKLEKRRLQFGDIILEKSGGGPKQPVGRVILFTKTEGSFSFSNFTSALRVLKPDELDFRFLHKFLHWTYLSGITETMQSNSTGIRNLDADLYKAIKISFPPLPEQERIVKLLDEADELRKLRAQADRRTAALLPALFRDMFGDPGANTKRWPTKTLGELLTSIDSGWCPVCHDRPSEPNEWGVLKLGAITSCKYRDTENKALPAELQPRPELEVQTGDLLFSRKNTYALVAACALVTSTRPKLMLSDLTFRLKIASTAGITAEYLWFALINPTKRKQVQQLAGGAAGSMPNISKERLRTVAIPLPPLPLQQEFARRVAEIRELESGQAASRLRLENLFQSMLHRAFTGEL